MKIEVAVNNVPDYAVDGEGFMVARLVDGQLWFYGLYDTEKRAGDVAAQIEGLIIERGKDECERVS